MNKIELLESLKNLTQKFNAKANVVEIVLKTKEMLESYLDQYPYDIEILFKISLAYHYLQDDIAALENLNKILEYDPKNAYAFIINVSITDQFYFIDDALFTKLENFKSNDNHIMSMIEYLKSKYFFTKSLSDNIYEKMQEDSLQKSIQLCNKYVWSYVKLANLYKDQNRLKEIMKLFIAALYNIKRVNNENCYYDFLNVEEFINEYITGIWINNVQYEHIVVSLSNCIAK